MKVEIRDGRIWFGVEMPRDAEKLARIAYGEKWERVLTESCPGAPDEAELRQWLETDPVEAAFLLLGRAFGEGHRCVESDKFDRGEFVSPDCIRAYFREWEALPADEPPMWESTVNLLRDAVEAAIGLDVDATFQLVRKVNTELDRQYEGEGATPVETSAPMTQLHRPSRGQQIEHAASDGDANGRHELAAKQEQQAARSNGNERGRLGLEHAAEDGARHGVEPDTERKEDSDDNRSVHSETVT